MDTPGPTTYSYSTTIGNGPKYRMRPKTAIEKREKIPGPGTYDPVPIGRRTPQVPKRNEKRAKLFEEAKKIPGPDAYTPNLSKSGPSFSFKGPELKRNSKLSKSKSDTPGPGSYKLMSTISNWPSYSASKKNCEFSYI